MRSRWLGHPSIMRFALDRVPIMIYRRSLIVCSLLVLAGICAGRCPPAPCRRRWHPADIRALLKACADIEARNKYGSTPLDYANDRTDSNAAARIFARRNAAGGGGRSAFAYKCLTLDRVPIMIYRLSLHGCL